MSKNRNYRDYSRYNREEPKDKPVIEETIVNDTIEEPAQTPETPEDPQNLGLDQNAFEETTTFGVITCERLRLRTSPNVEPNNISGIYNKGTKVTILKDLGEWLSVEVEKNSNRVRGFVMSKFIER